MDAELIVVSGAQPGARFSLGKSEFTIGRASAASLAIDEPGVAAEHCVVRASDSGYRLLDRHSGAGTYVNGLRVSDHPLQPEDQIAIGETVLIFREASAESQGDARHTLLQACSFLFLFRALASARDEQHRTRLRGAAACPAPRHSPCSGGARTAWPGRSRLARRDH